MKSYGPGGCGGASSTKEEYQKPTKQQMFPAAFALQV